MTLYEFIMWGRIQSRPILIYYPGILLQMSVGVLSTEPSNSGAWRSDNSQIKYRLSWVT